MADDWWSCLVARRHVSLRRLHSPAPDAAALQRIVEAAAQAPDHGQLIPWRFILISPERRAALGEAFVSTLLQEQPDADEARRAAARAKAFHCPCLLVAVLVDKESAQAISRDEKLISLGCAIQSMLVTAEALHFASGLASGRNMNAPALRHFLLLDADEQAMCFIGFGTAEEYKPARDRPQLASFFSTL